MLASLHPRPARTGERGVEREREVGEDKGGEAEREAERQRGRGTERGSWGSLRAAKGTP